MTTINGISADELAAKLESSQPLDQREGAAAAEAVRKYAEILEARKKGGGNSRKNAELKMDPASVANRERVRAHRKNKKT